MLAGAVRTDERQLPEVGQDSDDGDERQRAERLRTRASELDTQPALLAWAERLRQRPRPAVQGGAGGGLAPARARACRARVARWAPHARPRRREPFPPAHRR